MNLRERQERFEIENLSPLACKSAYTKGRKKPAEKCDMRTEFQKDRDRITHSKAFRRLMHKTQVFISPEGDHYRTRLTHTLEVTQIARTVARGIGLNEDLTEAIALGHDLGHTPFGHTGEDALDALMPGGFRHNEQSVRVVEFLENNGEGLNLTFEVVDGIFNHRTVGTPATLEGKVVQISDKIAYMNHDIDDALRAGVLRQAEIPSHILEVLGGDSRKRIDFLVRDLIFHSAEAENVSLTPHVAEVLYELRTFLYARVYSNQLQMNERNKIALVLKQLFDYYLKNSRQISKEISGASLKTHEGSCERAVCDYIAGMTDRFALKKYAELFIPSAWQS
ncbi:MAG: deoxyguanosinetriphosphate triphosphohydrolase [Clostridiales bacterium]|jgi:dGTPase|nr:deoxyguanosinetriphosphate triphosphohydrolase [Clostridiales bacterium]